MLKKKRKQINTFSWLFQHGIFQNVTLDHMEHKRENKIKDVDKRWAKASYKKRLATVHIENLLSAPWFPELKSGLHSTFSQTTWKWVIHLSSWIIGLGMTLLWQEIIEAKWCWCVPDERHNQVEEEDRLINVVTTHLIGLGVSRLTQRQAGNCGKGSSGGQ